MSIISLVRYAWDSDYTEWSQLPRHQAFVVGVVSALILTGIILLLLGVVVFTFSVAEWVVSGTLTFPLIEVFEAGLGLRLFALWLLGVLGAGAFAAFKAGRTETKKG